MLQSKLLQIHNKVFFIEDFHKYYVNKVEYKSTTSIIKKYYKPFNKYEIAEKLSKGDEVKKAELIYSWSVSGPYGSFIHKLLELHTTNYPVESNNLQFKKGVDLINILKSKGYDILFSELKLYNKESKIAGTIDLVMQNVLDPNRIILVDYKTCKSIPKHSYENESLLEPLEHLPDCKHTHYELQLSMYAYFIEKLIPEVIIEDLLLIHIPEDTTDAKIIKCEYLKEDIINILNIENGK